MAEDVGNVVRVDFGERFGAVPLAIPLDTVEHTRAVLEKIETTVAVALVVLGKSLAMGGVYANDDALRAVRDLIAEVSSLV